MTIHRRRGKPFEAGLLPEASWLPVTRDEGSSFSFRHIVTRAFPFPFHYHSEMELTYIVRGTGRRIVGEVVRPFADGDLALLGPMLPHVWMSDPQCPATEAFVLRFDGAMVGKLFQSQVECAAALAWIQRAGPGLEWRRKVPPDLTALFENLRRAPTPARRLLGVLDLIFTLAEAGPWHPICGGFRGIVTGSGEQRVGFALRYLRENFCGEISQAEVAGRVGMAPSAFSRLFQRATGRTFQSLLVELRVEHSCRLLSGTSLSVAEVCFAAGFRNLSNFNKHFLAAKRMSPRKYRNTLRV